MAWNTRLAAKASLAAVSLAGIGLLAARWLEPGGSEAKDLRSLSADDWRADLAQLAVDLPRRHANAFHRVSRARFASMVAQLDARIPELDADSMRRSGGRCAPSARSRSKR